MNLSENHLCSPCFPCFLGSRNWSNKNGPFHPSPISLLVASHTWPAPSIAPRKKPSNWECWWSQWNRIVFLIFHTDIELEIMMQLMIIIIVLIYHIYIWLYMYDICMKKSNFSFHWLLVSCHVVTKAHCAFHADFQGELDIHLQWKMATAKGYPVFDGHFNGKMLRPVRSPERNAWGYSNPFVSDNQHTTEPASKKKLYIFACLQGIHRI